MRKIHHIFFILLLGFALSGGYGPNLGRPPKAIADRNENLRESCRRLVGGMYISKYDEALQTRRYFQVLVDQNEKMTSALIKERIKLVKLEAAASNGEFDGTKATARDVQLGIVGNLEEQIKMNAAHRERAELLSKAKSDDESAMKRRLPPVFKISEFKGEKSQKGYSFRVDFVSDCPRYQFQCPLPEAHRNALLKMLPDSDMPIECKRYAAIGTPPKNN